jgi:hypothetical protein
MTTAELDAFFSLNPWAIPLIAVAVLWSISWTIIGLWTAARNEHKAWFLVFMFVHTLGILEMLYLSAQRRTK